MSLLVTLDPPGEVLAGDEAGPCPWDPQLLPRPGGFTPPPRGWGANSTAAQVAARVAGPRWAGPSEQRNSCRRVAPRPASQPALSPGLTACPVEGTFSGLERALTWWGPTGVCHPREYSSQDTGAECPAGGAVLPPHTYVCVLPRAGVRGGTGGGREDQVHCEETLQVTLERPAGLASSLSGG